MITPKTISKIAKTARKIEKATIHSVDGNTVNLQIGNSPTLIKHVEVSGDASKLVAGQIVTAIWVNDRPIVMGGSGYVSGIGNQNEDQELVPHTHMDIDSGGRLQNYLTKIEHAGSSHELGSVVPHDDHSKLSGLDKDDHVQYLRTDGARPITGNLVPYRPGEIDLGAATNPFGHAYFSEINSVIFAEETASLLGGYLIIAKDEARLTAKLLSTDLQATFSKEMTPGNIVVFRAGKPVEYIKIGSLVSGTTYWVDSAHGGGRDLGGDGLFEWPDGSVCAVLGTVGDGRIELNSYDTPRISLIKMKSNTYSHEPSNFSREIIRIGDLNGGWGYASEKWGIAIGEFEAGKPNIVLDEDGNLKIRLYTTDVMSFGSGAANIVGDLNVTDGKILAGNGGVQLDADGVTINPGLGGENKVKWGSVSSPGNSLVYLYGYEGTIDPNYTQGYLNLEATGNPVGGSAYIDNAWGEILLKVLSPAQSNSVSLKLSKAGLRLFGGSEGGVADMRIVKTAWGGGNLTADDIISASNGFKWNSQFLQQPDGWTPANETWTYVSATTFRISGDVRTKYPIGTKLKLTQTSVKYFYVVATSYSSPNTTITVTAGSDYTLANAAITGNYLSYANTPQGFPNAFNYVPSWTSDGTQPSIGNGVRAGRFTIIGKTVHCRIKLVPGSTTTYGTGVWRFSTPVPDRYELYMLGVARFYDYSTNVTYHGFSSCVTSTGTMIAFNSVSPSSAIGPTIPFTWAASDELFINISYEMA